MEPLISGLANELGAKVLLKFFENSSFKLKQRQITKKTLKEFSKFLVNERISKDDVKRISQALSKALDTSPPAELVAAHYEKPEKIAHWLLDHTPLVEQTGEKRLAIKFVTAFFDALIKTPEYHKSVVAHLEQRKIKLLSETNKSVSVIQTTTQDTYETTHRTDGTTQRIEDKVDRLVSVSESKQPINPDSKVFGPNIRKSVHFFDPED